MALLVLDPGVRATVQDAGHPGYRSCGVPPGGAFDPDAHALANALAGNSGPAAALELTLVGGRYRAALPLLVGLAGAPMAGHIDGRAGRRPLHLPQSARLAPGEVLVLGGTPRGARTYLAVRGGWQTRPILGSRSSETPLQAGDRLPAEPAAGLRPTRRPAFALDDDVGPIRIIAGPDAPAGLDPSAWSGLEFEVQPQADRMGVRLAGPTPPAVAGPADRASLPVAWGAIQVTGAGPIVLGPACGTMGGYPVAAFVISTDLGRLAQLRPGDRIRFSLIDLHDARRLDAEHRRARRGWAIRTAALAASDAT